MIEICNITGFTGTCAYVHDIDGNYITQKEKSYKQINETKKIKEA